MIRARAGFTLVEIMIVAAIIGMLAGIAIPSFMKASKRSRITRFSREIVNAASAFQLYCIENGGWPPDVVMRVMPAGMEDYLKGFNWTDTTCIGGLWDWDEGEFDCKAGVSVYMPTVSDEDMAEVDAILDDGDLNDGIFRQRSQGFIFILENN